MAFAMQGHQTKQNKGVVILYDNRAVEPHTGKGSGQNSKVSERNLPLCCTIMLIAMQGHLHWVVVHNLIGYNTVQYSIIVIIYDNSHRTLLRWHDWDRDRIWPMTTTSSVIPGVHLCTREFRGRT